MVHGPVEPPSEMLNGVDCPFVIVTVPDIEAVGLGLFPHGSTGVTVTVADPVVFVFVLHASATEITV